MAGVLGVLALLGLAAAATGETQRPQQPAQAGATAWRAGIVNLTRVESWHFFEPPPSGGDPDSTFIGNRLRLTVNGAWKRLDFNAAAQYVQFGGLPRNAVGPGPLGTGALYFQHAGKTDSRGAYLRAVNVRARLPGGVSLQAGRFGYTSGAEAPSGRPKIESVKRTRIDSRMIGEFEWSLYQRTYDGIRGDVDHRAWHATGAWLRPTQGGFEERAGANLGDIDVIAGTVAIRPDVALPRTDLMLFSYRYEDSRAVAARPDNTGRTAARVDVGVNTFGAAAVGAAPADRGEADWLLWFAGQTGSWYEQRHRAWSLAVEGGYQWKARWQPWLRAGYLAASGDGDPRDNRHGTFFPMLPTARKYSFTTAHATMNLRDLFVEAIVRPTARVGARADARRLWLANGNDRWYAGSGATVTDGTYFGYAGRTSGGSSDLAPLVLQAAADVAIDRHWSANVFVGGIRGGDAVAALLPGRWLRFVYFENIVQW